VETTTVYKNHFAEFCNQKQPNHVRLAGIQARNCCKVPVVFSET